MKHQELDFVILGSLMTTLHNDETTVARGDINLQKANHYIKAIKKHYLGNGVKSQVHKSAQQLQAK